MAYDEEYVLSLYEHMDNILNVVVQTFGQAGVLLPDRQYVAFGQTAHDCEQVTVSFQQIYLGPPGDQAQVAQPCDGPRSTNILVEIVRCIPTVNERTGAAPSVESIVAAARQQAIDAWMLMEAARNTNDYAVLADVSAGEPQGKYQAVVLSLTSMV